MAFSGRPRGPARIRVALPALGAAAGRRAPGSRPAPLRAARARAGARAALYDRQLGRPALGPRPIYEPAAGPRLGPDCAVT